MVDDVPVAQVLQALAEQEKLNLVVSPDVSGTVSLHLTDVPWKQALQTVVKSAGLITRQEGNILSVHSVAWQNDNIARQEAEEATKKQAAYSPKHLAGTETAQTGSLAQTGDRAGLIGETFAIGGTVLVAAGVFLDQKKRREQM